jgi:hypothetical protein
MIADSRIPGSRLGTLLNVFLGEHIPWPYHAGPGSAIDSTGSESPKFESLIYTSPEPIERVPADNLACVIDVHENLSLERLRQSYERIAQVKALTKTTIPTVSEGVPVADASMGIIFARDSDAPIEALAEELARLNEKHSYRVWPDMIVVLSLGTVNLACQIPKPRKYRVREKAGCSRFSSEITNYYVGVQKHQGSWHLAHADNTPSWLYK